MICPILMYVYAKNKDAFHKYITLLYYSHHIFLFLPIITFWLFCFSFRSLERKFETSLQKKIGKISNLYKNSWIHIHYSNAELLMNRTTHSTPVEQNKMKTACFRNAQDNAFVHFLLPDEFLWKAFYIILNFIYCYL